MTETEAVKRQGKRKRLRVQSVIFLMSAVCLAGGAIYFLFFYNWDAYKRQDIEESLAVSFIEYLVEYAEEIEEETAAPYTPDYSVKETAGMMEGSCPESSSKEMTGTCMTAADGVIHMGSVPYEEQHYYSRGGITFTPDYAVGYLLCVLEYPDVGIKRGVYSGTWDEIYQNLDMWMVTMARPDMVLGQTHLAIYGHNHTSQNLSFNNLNKAKVGDQFYLYAESGIYTYEVTDIFSDWRTDTTCKYVDDFTVGSDICYIITCGRDYFPINGSGTRYQDFIVEGHLIRHQRLSEYAKELLDEEKDWRKGAAAGD